MLIYPWIYQDVISNVSIDPCLLGRSEAHLLRGSGGAEPAQQTKVYTFFQASRAGLTKEQKFRFAVTPLQVLGSMGFIACSHFRQSPGIRGFISTAPLNFWPRFALPKVVEKLSLVLLSQCLSNKLFEEWI